MKFLNEEHDLGFPPDWHRTDLSRLWHYNLHYLNFLWDLDFDGARRWALDWIEKNPAERGSVGWEPYPVSLRLVNLCAVFWGRHRDLTERDSVLCAKLWETVYRQAEFLRRHTETHLLGNHYLENGAALALTGACFGGTAAGRWHREGMAILREQLAEQILPDGGHFERAPMYHARVLWVLAMLSATGGPDRGRFPDPLNRTMRVLSVLRHPDGGLALLNDSAHGIYPAPDDLLDFAARHAGSVEMPGDGCFALDSSGYYGWRSADGYIICDCGPIGPDEIPGHAHGDMFSFELSLNGHRVIVDSGVYGYERGEMRDYCRSTRAHNTLEVEGLDQCEFWASHRVARRGRPREVQWREERDGFSLSAWHDGYTRLPGKPTHERCFRWWDSGRLSVEDTVTTARPVRVASRLHLDPACRVLSLDRGTARVAHPGGECRIRFSGPGALRKEGSTYCPEFGLALQNECLVWEASGERITAGLEILS